jgi:DNA polymerase III subunit gamma/tau
MLYVPQVTRGPTHFFMQYQVLARKWRPQNFHELVGQEHVAQTLLNALKSGRVAHAFLFSGPRGSGKTTSARILAKALNCHAGAPGEPCGTCVSCVEIAASNSMDVLEMDAASHGLIDQIREVIDAVNYNPARDRNRIYILDEVHMLSIGAFNALLKTLEEPPPHVVFIMATTEYHKIPATILSRCQQYSFKLIPYSLILQRLQYIAAREKIEISTSALEQVAFASGGSMRDAMSAFDQVLAFSGASVRDEDVIMLLGLVEPAVLEDTTRAIAGNDAEKAIRVVSSLVEAGQDLPNFWRRLLAHFRNLMVVKSGISDPGIVGVPETLMPRMRAQADLFSREDLLRLYDSLFKIEGELKYATQVRFQVEMGLIELSQISRLRSLEELIEEFQRLANGDLTPPPASRSNPPDGSASGGSPSGSTRNSRPIPEGTRTGPAANSSSQGMGTNVQPEPSQPSPGDQPQDLLLRIAGAVSKASLEPVIHSLGGAELNGDVVVLNPGTITEFYRRQIRENLPVIVQAASAVLGRPVRVQIGSEASRTPSPEVPMPSRSPLPAAEPKDEKNDLMDRVQKEPVIRSFLDVFPGPVKAEKIDK